MFVGWFCTRDLDVDSQGVVLASLRGRGVREVLGALLPYAGRICKALATNTQVTDLFDGEAAMSLEGQ